MIVLSLGYNDDFAIPDEMLPLVAKMVPVQEIGKNWVKRDCTINIKVVDANISTGEEDIKVRLAKAQQEAEERTRYWEQERKKTETLAARIKELEGKT